MKRNQSGFTLIEIAIVLVIIGLLLGGVMKGQELINSAKVKNLAADFKNTSLFIYGYQDKFRSLPGDDPQAASHVTGATVATAITAGDLGNGLINGKWDSTTNTDESFLFWQHVRLAGLAAGITNTADALNYPQRNTIGGVVGITNSTANDNPIYTAGAGGVILKGAYIICSANIPGKFAKQLDIMMDDGNTASGSMMTQDNNNGAPWAIGQNIVGKGAKADPVEDQFYTVCMGV